MYSHGYQWIENRYGRVVILFIFFLSSIAAVSFTTHHHCHYPHYLPDFSAHHEVRSRSISFRKVYVPWQILTSGKDCQTPPFDGGKLEWNKPINIPNKPRLTHTILETLRWIKEQRCQMLESSCFHLVWLFTPSPFSPFLLICFTCRISLVYLRCRSQDGAGGNHSFPTSIF